MNKRELARIYNTITQGKISQKAALEEIDIFTQTLQEDLMKYDSVTFVNIGVFEMLERKPRLVSNPSTREIMTIYPKKVVRFRASKNLIK